MAEKKQKQAVEEAELINAPATANDLLSFLSEEEKAEMLAMTGQASNLQGERIPAIKVNYCDTADVHGNSIKKGNFVYDQSASTVDVEVADEDGDVSVEPRMENLGFDLGKSPSITILAYRQQYSYFNQDAKQRCSSQVYTKGETPVGNNLKHECQAGTCWRRGKEVDRKEKCACQYVLYCLVEIDGEQKPAIMYVKGKSFMPFGDYLKSLGSTPLFCISTKLKNSMEKEGSVTYFIISFNQGAKLADEICAANYQMMKDTVKGIEEFKKTQVQKAAKSTLVDKSAGGNAKQINFDASDDGDTIQFD